MKKLYIDKNDTVAAIVEKIVNSEDSEIVLYVPRFTKLSDTSNNFRLLKREIESTDKAVEIESVDDEVLVMAKAAGINARNPFFQKNKKSFSDIVSPGGNLGNESGHHEGNVKIHSHKNVESDEPQDEMESDIVGPVSREVELDEEDVLETRDGRKKPIHSKISRLRKKISFRLKGDDEENEGLVVSPAKWIAGAVIALIIIIAAATLLSRAKITVALDKVNWNFSGTIYASTVIKDPYFANGQARIAGVVLQKDKNITGTFPATGTEDVNRKASGQITIYNAYSTAPQALVKDTRFATPDGKIFRIREGIVVPGAKLVNNKLVPSTLVVTVYADKPGADYNIPPATFRIPGFQGSPKYEGFSAQSTAPMMGGLIGVGKVATSIDIAKAKDQNKKNLSDALRTELTLSVPQEIKLLSGASVFTVTKEVVSPDADSAGNFTVTTAGTLKLFGFKEDDFTKALKSALVNAPPAGATTDSTEAISNDDLVLKSGTPQYGNPQVDFNNNNMTMSVTIDSVWVHAFDADRFRTEALGKSPEELNASIKNFPGVKWATVSLWPFWVMHVPGNPNKVTIDVQ